MYVEPNYKTKKSLKDALAEGKRVRAFQAGGMFPGATDGKVSLEGPHYPAPHTWYATCVLKDGYVVPGSVK